MFLMDKAPVFLIDKVPMFLMETRGGAHFKRFGP